MSHGAKGDPTLLKITGNVDVLDIPSLSGQVVHLNSETCISRDHVSCLQQHMHRLCSARSAARLSISLVQQRATAHRPSVTRRVRSALEMR